MIRHWQPAGPALDLDHIYSDKSQVAIYVVGINMKIEPVEDTRSAQNASVLCVTLEK